MPACYTIPASSACPADVPGTNGRPRLNCLPMKQRKCILFSPPSLP